jgi:hypothetical protein
MPTEDRKDAGARVRSMTTEQQFHLLFTVLELEDVIAKVPSPADNAIDPKCMSEAEKDAFISDGDALLNEITELAITAWGLVQ